MADGMACLEDENSTDCLLRELLKTIKDKDKEYNWDPLTFGFLVPIGLVAAFFGALTIFQAIWSAGSGRRLCNKIAIGQWSKLTKTKWSWHDLTLQSTAKTPLLRSKRILTLLNDDKNGQQNPGNSEHASTDRSSNATSAATWLNFLQEINLEDLALSGKDKDIAETAADYLPSDLLAVPAYGEVGFIVAMAAAAGAYSWKFSAQSPYPIIIGEDFQFDFRQHPTIGTVGAFSKYGQRVARESPTREYLAEAIKHAKGEIDIATLFREPWSLKVNIVELPDIQDLIRRIHRQDACTRTEPDDLCTLPSYIDGSDEHLLWLFIADTPEHPPAIFPSGLVRVPNLLSILALNSNYWAIGSNFRAMPDGADQSIPLDIIEWRALTEAIEPALDHRLIVGYKDIYRACIKILYEPQVFQAWIDSKGRSKRQEFRQGVVAQLKQIDTWLQKRDRQQELRCSIVEIYHITNALLKAEKAITNGWLGAAVPADQAGAQQINPGDNSKQDTTDGPSNPDDEYLGMIVNRHFKTLTTLRDGVKEFVSSIIGVGEDSKSGRKIFEALVRISPYPTLLDKLGELLETLENNKEKKQSEHSDIETIKDVVIWRCILIYLLFGTAPDNSELLSSGLWEHVIPII